jgi:hypothetical protein
MRCFQASFRPYICQSVFAYFVGCLLTRFFQLGTILGLTISSNSVGSNYVTTTSAQYNQLSNKFHWNSYTGADPFAVSFFFFLQ